MLQAVERTKLYEQVVEQIKDLIAQGLYKKGDALPSEKELTKTLGVSRITVREGLKLLSEAGIIETIKGKGSFVLVDSSLFNKKSDINYGELFLNSTKARIFLEPSIAAEVALHASDSELEEIAKLASQDNREFHKKIYEATHNPIVLQWFNESIDVENKPETFRFIPPTHQKTYLTTIQQQHEKIAQALRSRNSEFAYLYMKEHLIYIAQIHQQYFDVFS